MSLPVSVPVCVPVCVIGGGLIGARHAEVAQACGAVRLTAVVEPDGATRAALAAQGYPAVPALEDVPGETRAAIVATPTPLHLESAEAALSLGWAVLVEKPVAATLGEARRLVARAGAAGLPLAVGHHRRCHAVTQAARAAVAGLGQPVGAQGLWSLRKHESYFAPAWRRAPGAGPLMTNLSHELDLLQFLMGRIVEVTALASSARRGLPIEDSAAIALRFESGALGSFLISDAGASPWSFEAATGENPMIAATGEDYLRITGTEGALAFPSLTRWQGRDWRETPVKAGGERPARVDPLAEQMARFAATVAGRPDPVLCTAAEGLAALEMTLAAALSAREGRPVKSGEMPEDYSGT